MVLILASLAIWFMPWPVVAAAPVERVIDVHASSFEYQPGTVRVNPGDKVTLELSSTDVTHGIYIDGYNLEVIAEPGQPQQLSFVAEKAGSFRLRCSVTCGSLHPFMIGKLQVGPNNLLWRSIAISILGILAIFWIARK